MEGTPNETVTKAGKGPLEGLLGLSPKELAELKEEGVV